MSFFGIYRGIVVDIDLMLNRVKATVPMVLGTEISDWAVPCVPPGWSHNLLANHANTSDSGGDTAVVSAHSLVYKTPQRGKVVWVMFEGGDPAHPVWVGGME